MDLTDKSQLLTYLKEHGLWAKKGLGQNFLVDRISLEKIVEAAELTHDDFVVEVGPGVGTLTQELVDRAGEVIAIEMDEKLAELLNCSIVQLLTTPKPLLGKEGNNAAMKQSSNEKVKIISADILKLNLNEVIGDRPYKVVANIPYYITSKIIQLFLSREHKPEIIILLVQKEVAERVCAKPGEMSVLAASVQLYGRPEIVDIVPKESFFPSPKVDSAILKIANIHTPTFSPLLRGSIEGVEEKAFFRAVHIGFSSKRKTLLNNLSNGYRLDRKTVSGILNEVGLKDNSRAQELSIDEWKRLAEAIN